MSEMMLVEAGRLMMRRLWIPLWSLRRVRRGISLTRPANVRAGKDGDNDLDEADVGCVVEINVHGDNAVGDME